MEHNAQSPVIERSGAEDFQNGNAQQQQQQQQMEGVAANTDSLSLRSTKQSSSPFSRLPRNVIERILYTVDPSAFASLALLNRKWRRISDAAPLYIHHLSHCPSFSATRDSMPYSESLDSLKRSFFAEIRRNAFDVFLRPRQTLVKLISTSMSSSTAFPKGEAFRFSFSASGHMILCLSSSRIVVLDITAKLPVVKHELKTSRRPLDATILDDGLLLAVVSSRHQINIYSLSDDDSKLIQCLVLNDTPRALALSPTGGVLAIAYDDKIEMQAVGEGVIAADRRAVRCNSVDSISFSPDGFMLLGSSARGRTSSIVSVTVPFYTGTEDDISPGDAQVRMWTTQVLFPASLQGYTRACSLPFHEEGEDDWVLGYDEQRGAFRVVRISNANAGTVYFPSPFSPNIYQKASPVMSPAVDGKGELVALGYEDSGLWVHGIPNRLDVASSARSSPGFLQQSGAISGHKLSDIPGITASCWVGYSHSSAHPASKGLRLVTVAPGGVSPPSIGEEDVPVDGGRVLLLDFDRSPRNGEAIEVSIELGEAEPKMLTEPNSSMDTEVELERRRTQLRRNNTAAPRRLRNPARETHPPSTSSASQKVSYCHRRNSSYQSDSNTPRLNATLFGDAQPRTGDTLQRAVTAAAVNPRRYSNPRQPQTQRYIPQVPHESDADNWVPPPPPYTREPAAPLPENLRRTLLPVPPELRRAQSTSQDNASRNRPALHRLNTITARMMRIGARDPQADEDDNGQRRVLQRIREGALGQFNQGRDEPVPPVPPIPELHQPPATEEFTIVQSPQYINSAPAAPQAPQAPSTPLVSPTPSETLASSRSRRQSTRSNQTEHVVSQAVASNLMEPIPYIQEEESPTTINQNQNQYPFSFSSPNLGGPGRRFPGAAEDSPASPTARRTWYQRVPPNGRSQSQDLREVLPPRPTPAMNRRASTDPTLSNRSPSTAAVNESWRRRIEEWNERTIHETNKKNRKCVVM
ncbi:F-box domain protein [Aspergillus ruber CBS 135680]|uniref:F-box domain-containing protein n=1 Tax=Aspergillus ruber (strain CBS 135680) TaxID=1388766 RepID=A0A017SP25_ASPRC|nr:uncharacterized protein EURHEDRAFT_513077 [Aspergillus ruber CBS 135680]EYE98010.1 hypothetical protein EURHEDRAFT_513077 [Aspergillus ruber CBS 135680]